MRFPARPVLYFAGLTVALLLAACGTTANSPGNIANAPVKCAISPGTADQPGRGSGADEISTTFLLRGFRVDQLWGGQKGYPSVLPYRAKITLWATYAADDTGDQQQAVAELFFYDPSQEANLGPNPDALNSNKVPEARYHLRFPISTFDGIVYQLSSAGQPVYLVYYHPAHENEWAIVTKQDRPVKVNP